MYIWAGKIWHGDNARVNSVGRNITKAHEQTTNNAATETEAAPPARG